MRQPIKTGDRCEVTGGALGEGSGPNVGKEVIVGKFMGEHSQWGRIWRCHGENIVTEYGALGSEADFAACWLYKLDPDQDTSFKSEDKHLTA